VKKYILLLILLKVADIIPFNGENVPLFATNYSMLGIYKDGYPMMNRLANYRLDKDMLVSGLPISLIREILTERKVSIVGKTENELREVFSKLDFNDVLSYLVFNNSINAALVSNVSTLNTVYNVVFHSMLSFWRAKLIPPKRGDFNINQKMGLFTYPSGGISSASEGISINTISAQTIHLHDYSYSPNNARFKLDTSRKVVAFWIVGFLDDIKKISISLQVIFLDDFISQNFSFLTKESLIRNLKSFKTGFLGKNSLAVQEIIDFLESKVLVTAPVASTSDKSEVPIRSVQQIIQECLDQESGIQPVASSSQESELTLVERIIQECLNRSI
jgi:hypothetical protein